VDGSTRRKLRRQFALSIRIPACPFCLSPPQTFAEQMARADVVLIAELVDFRVVDFGRRAESTLRIREYLRGAEIARELGRMEPGRSLTVDADFSAAPGGLFLMYGDLPDFSRDAGPTFATADSESEASAASGVPVRTASLQTITERSGTVRNNPKTRWTAFLSPSLISWNDSTAVSHEAVAYLKSLPETGRPQSDRLPFYVKWLEHPDAAIAIDAWAEFANSEYADVISVRRQLPREDLKRWIADPLAGPDRLGLYGLMLGLCGTPEDAEFLYRQMHDGSGDFRFGGDGLMGGYLLLAGESGLARLERSLVTTQTPRTESMFALVQALSFLQSYESNCIPSERLRQSMRLFLAHDALREIAVTHLARWQDWDILPALIRMHDEDCADDPMSRRAIVQFAQVCRQAADVPGSGAVSRELAATAAAFLAAVQQSTR
jgi:hypothetical protein